MKDPDDIEQQLDAAGHRLRATAPDSAAALRALRASTRPGEATTGPAARSWWPLAWAGGLTAAAVITAIVLVGGDTPDTVRELPADAPPDTLDGPPPADPVPTIVDATVASTASPPGPSSEPAASGPVATTLPAETDRTVVTEFRDADCFRLSVDTSERRLGSAAGCIPAENFTPDRLFVTQLGQEIHRVDVVDGAESEAAPELTVAPLPDWGTASCGIIDTFMTFSSSDVVLEIVGCDQSDPDAPVAVAARIPQTVGDPPGYFSTPGRNTAGGVALTAPVPLDGVLGAEVLFSTPLPEVRCALIVPAARTAWSEQCWADFESPAPALALLDGRVVQLDLRDDTAPRGYLLDERGLPPVGCGLDELRDLMSVDEIATHLVFTGAICAELNATLTFSGPVVSNIGADGGFIEFDRPERFEAWTSRGRGTAGVTLPSLAVPADDVWSAWPGQTRSFPFDPDWADSTEAATAAGVADRVVQGLNAASPSEFPANARVVAVLERLVVVLEDVGGDDSADGAVHYVHLVDDGAGALAIRDWFVGSICARDSGPTELCI